jgi:hypothetical protein
MGYQSAADEELEFTPYAVLSAGMYKCRPKDISNLDNLQFGPAVKFHWEVLEGDEAGEEVSGIANKVLTPRSKLAGWAKAHLSISAFPPGFVLRFSELINKTVYVTIGVEARKDGMGDTNVIRAVDPVRAPKTAKPVKPKKVDDDFNDMLSGQGPIPDPGDPLPRSGMKIEE